MIYVGQCHVLRNVASLAPCRVSHVSGKTSFHKTLSISKLPVLVRKKTLQEQLLAFLLGSQST